MQHHHQVVSRYGFKPASFKKLFKKAIINYTLMLMKLKENIANKKTTKHKKYFNGIAEKEKPMKNTRMAVLEKIKAMSHNYNQ